MFPEIFPLTETTGAEADRQEGNIIVQPIGTLNQVINVVVESDPCPKMLWTFTRSSGTTMNVTSGSQFTLNDPCMDDTESSPYNFTLTIANLTEATSGQYSVAFTVLSTVVRLERLLVTVPSKSVFSVSLCVGKEKK